MLVVRCKSGVGYVFFYYLLLTLGEGAVGSGTFDLRHLEDEVFKFVFLNLTELTVVSMCYFRLQMSLKLCMGLADDLFELLLLIVVPTDRVHRL
jgi:hypothetical protein